MAKRSKKSALSFLNSKIGPFALWHWALFGYVMWSLTKKKEGPAVSPSALPSNISTTEV